MKARVFATSVDGADAAYREIALHLGAAESEGLYIDAHLEHRCVIINFIASDEFRQAVGPLVQSKESIEALKLLLEAVKAAEEIAFGALTGIGSLVTAVGAARSWREKSLIRRNIDRERLTQETLKSEILRAELDKARAGSLENRALPSDRTMASLSDPQFLRRVFPALGEILLPIATGQASSVTLEGGASPSVATVTADEIAPVLRRVPRRDVTIQSPIKGRQIRPSSSPHEFAFAQAPQDHVEQREATVIFEAVQLDRSKNNWRVRIDGNSHRARMLDQKFLDDVATARHIVHPGTLYNIRYTEKWLQRDVRIDIQEVKNRP